MRNLQGIEEATMVVLKVRCGVSTYHRQVVIPLVMSANSVSDIYELAIQAVEDEFRAEEDSLPCITVESISKFENGKVAILEPQEPNVEGGGN